MATAEQRQQRHCQDAPTRPRSRCARPLSGRCRPAERRGIQPLHCTNTDTFVLDRGAPISVEQKAAITFAHQNRSTQMNRQAQVMDAFRKIEVAADALQSQLNVNGQIGIGTAPTAITLIDSTLPTLPIASVFNSMASQSTERTECLSSFSNRLPTSSRNYTAGKDVIANEVRAALRQIELRRLNFQIARQQLVAASRQVDQAQINLRPHPIEHQSHPRLAAIIARIAGGQKQFDF